MFFARFRTRRKRQIETRRPLGLEVLEIRLALAGTVTFVEFLADGLTDGQGNTLDGLRDASSVAVSPDGAHLYATGPFDNGMAVFSRDNSTGKLTFVESLMDGGLDGQGNTVDGLEIASSAAVSPDGSHVYVLGFNDDSIALFDRNGSTGELTFAEVLKDGQTDGQGNTIAGLDGASHLVVAPDGAHVYTVGHNAHSMSVFARDSITGQLTFVEILTDSLTDGAGNTIDGLRNVNSVTISADGAHVYTAAGGDAPAGRDDAVAVFSRNSATGELNFVEMLRDGQTDSAGNFVDGLHFAFSVTVSPGGSHVYAAGRSDDGIALFDRNSTTGELTFVEVLKDGLTDGQGNVIDGLDGAQGMAVSPSGSHVYSVSRFDSALTLFDRDPLTGRLTFVETVKDGLTDSQGNPVEGLRLAQRVTLSPDGNHVYTAAPGDSSLAVFLAAVVNTEPDVPVDDDASPNQVAEGAAVGTSVGITAFANDPDGDVISYSLLDDAGGRFAIDTSTGVVSVADSGLLDFETTASHLITVRAQDPSGASSSADFTISVLNANPSVPADVDGTTNNVIEGVAAGTLVGITAFSADPNGPAVTFSLTDDVGGRFAIDATSGEVTVANVALIDFETDTSHLISVQASDGAGGTATANFTIEVLNQPSITGVVFVDVNENGLFEANEPGIDGVTIELFDELGSPILDAASNPITATTSSGGFYLLEDLNPGTYQIHEIQPSGVNDGPELLGSLGGSIPANDTMQLTLDRIDAADYVFAELGQTVTSGDTATIGFWQNKHGQDLIEQGGTAVADWLTANFSNVFGDEFVGGNGSDVASFFKDQLFKQKGKQVAGPAKVDPQFLAVALATFFTSSNLAGSVASGFGFNVTDTGIGTHVVNIGTNGAAFDVADNTDRTIVQLLLATSDLTDLPDNISGFAHIYDQDGDGLITDLEVDLRVMANEVYTAINEGGET